MDSKNNIITKYGLDKIDISPLTYWWHFLNPNAEIYVPSESVLFEEAFKIAVFQSDKFESNYVKYPKLDLRKPIEKAEFLAIESACLKMGKKLIKQADYDKIISMRESILKHTVASKLCLQDKLTQSFNYHEKDSGAIIAFKPHYVNPSGLIINLNSTKDICLYEFQKEAWKKRHDKKSAIQLDGTGAEEMIFISVENEAPYNISIRYLDQRSISLGRETYKRNCETYIECLESGIWIGSEPKITEVSLPEWVFNKF